MPYTRSKSGFSHWSPRQLPDLTGRTYVITGANSGIGYEAARMLSAHGGNIVMACRSQTKGEAALASLARTAKGTVDLVTLDLSDLSSVRSCAEVVRKQHDRIDGLINNAGIMMTPQQTTTDGFDLQVGTNHLGHFLWTGLLYDRVEAAEGRIVVLSSIVHKYFALDIDDFMIRKNYTPIRAYTQSKLANLMFAIELDRRLMKSGSKAVCIACHPGYSDTNLQTTGPTGIAKMIMRLSNTVIAQSPKAGAVPTVLAAAGLEAQRGAYYGPTGLGDMRGRVSDAKVADHALDTEKQARLWDISEELVGLKWLS